MGKRRDHILRRAGLLVSWLALAALLATAYGIVNDQITVTLSPEYFSVFKRRMFWWLVGPMVQAGAPLRLQAAAVGAAATWWYGLALALILCPFALLGRPAPLSTMQFARIVTGIMAVTLATSVLFGVAAWTLTPTPDVGANPFLNGIQDVHRAYAVGWWHNGAYLGALAGTLLGCQQAWRARAGAERSQELRRTHAANDKVA